MSNDTASRRLEAELRGRIVAGSPGSRLPPNRTLIARFGVSPVTVRRIMARLEREGLIETRVGVGTFVARRPRRGTADLSWQSEALGAPRASADDMAAILAPPQPGAVVLSAGYPSADLLPLPQLTAAMSRAARRPEAWDRIPLAGLPGLRAWFAHDLGSGLAADDIVIAPGNQAALVSALRALTRPGQPVLVESPTYAGALVAARANGLEAVPVLSDPHGPVPDRLAERFAETKARVFYAQPAFANPTGRTWSARRRREVLEVTKSVGAFVIEDDWADRLHFGESGPGRLVSDDSDGHVVYLRGLSKSLGPGMRVAAVAARGPAAIRLRAARIIEDICVSGVLQEAALDLLSSSGFERHLRQLRRSLIERRDSLIGALSDQFSTWVIPHVPNGGFHLWVRVDVSEAPLALNAARQGLVITPGRSCFPGEPPGDYLRLSFAGARADSLVSGIRQLAETVELIRQRHFAC